MIHSQTIPNQWYPIIESRKVKGRKPIGVTRLSENLVLWRDRFGRLIAMPDRCPHRGAMLSLGKINHGCLACPYHGLRFNASGKCVMIPANGEGAPVPHGFDIITRLVREDHGLVWLWNGDPAQATDELPWFNDAPELVGSAASLSYTTGVRYLRVIENLADFHHLPFVHKWSIPGVGPRADNVKAVEKEGMLTLSVTMRYERPGRFRPDASFEAQFRLPSMARINFQGIRIAYAVVPVDEKRTWIHARYGHDYLSRAFGGRMLSRAFSQLDRWVFSAQDTPVLESQADALADFSNYHLYEADRGIGLFFAMMHRAMREGAVVENEFASAAAGGR